MHTFDKMVISLKQKFRITRIDLPGFGMSDEPTDGWTVNDYVKFLRKFINDYQLEDAFLLGHSFGGRIAIKYASKYKVTKLVLVSSAGIVHNRFKKNFSILNYKIKKFFYKKLKLTKKYLDLVNSSGSEDYKNATKVMKKTLSKVVKEDLKKEIKKISSPTLLIWGKEDQITPYKDAIIINKLIKSSGLVSFDDCGHFSYLENCQDIVLILENFFGDRP